MKDNKVFFLIVNVDWFFLSHRLPLAMAMKNRDYEVYILTKDTGRKKEIKANGLKFIEVDFERSGKNPWKELLIIQKLIRLFKKFQPKIIHNVTIKPAIYSSIALKFYKKKDVKFINAISGLGYNFTRERNGIMQKVIKSMMRFAYKGNIYFIFQNPDDMELYRNMGFIVNNNFRIIKGAGVDTSVFRYNEPLQKSKIEIVFVARMLLDKGIRELIEAAKILRNTWESKACFKLIGDVDEANLSSLKKADLDKIVIPGYIEWLGYTTDIQPSLIMSDIACLPSYREGLPKSLIEAMAIGRPIVTTDVPGCRECVDDKVNGFLVPVHDGKALAKALETLMLDPELRIEMGKASRQKVISEMSLQQVIAETFQFYEQI